MMMTRTHWVEHIESGRVSDGPALPHTPVKYNRCRPHLSPTLNESGPGQVGEGYVAEKADDIDDGNG